MRTAVYARVAVRKPTEQLFIKENPPIEKQLDLLREHILARGETQHGVDVFRDEGHSGGTLDRPALNRLRARVSLGAYERVLVASYDRLARNHKQLRALIEEFRRSGCRVESLH